MADLEDQVVPEFSFPVFCECVGENGRPIRAVERTWWGAANPARRYFSCRYRMSTDVTRRRCAMFIWKDGGLTGHYRNVLNSLTQEIKRHYVPVASVVDLEDEIEALNVEKIFLIRDKEKLSKMVGELELLLVEEKVKNTKMVGELELLLVEERVKNTKLKTELNWWKVVCVGLVIGFVAVSLSRVV